MLLARTPSSTSCIKLGGSSSNKSMLCVSQTSFKLNIIEGSVKCRFCRNHSKHTSYSQHTHFAIYRSVDVAPCLYSVALFTHIEATDNRPGLRACAINQLIFIINSLWLWMVHVAPQGALVSVSPILKGEIFKGLSHSVTSPLGRMLFISER